MVIKTFVNKLFVKYMAQNFGSNTISNESTLFKNKTKNFFE